MFPDSGKIDTYSDANLIVLGTSPVKLLIKWLDQNLSTIRTYLCHDVYDRPCSYLT